MSKLLSIQEFAVNVGRVGREIRDAALPFHIAYKGGSFEQRADLRKRWMLGHLEGQKVQNPERILSEGKGKDAKPDNIKAIDRAYSDFSYYVARPEKKKKEDQASKADIVAQALALVEQMTAAQKRKFLASI
jgi:hypothetical protein